jgi:hypothetical protein
METQWIAQIEHEQYEVNEQKYDSDRISDFRHGGEDRRRRKLADRGGHEQAGRHAVEQNVPRDHAVPRRYLGYRNVCVAVHFRNAKEAPQRAVRRSRSNRPRRNERNLPPCSATD